LSKIVSGDSKDDMDFDEDFEDLEEEFKSSEEASEAPAPIGGIFSTEDERVKKVSAGSIVNWEFVASPKTSPTALTFSVVYGRDDAPEWEVSLSDGSAEIWNSAVTGEAQISVDNPKRFYLSAECPSGVRYGDSARIEIKAKSSASADSMDFEAVAKQSIMILKTQIDQEKSVADTLNAKAHLGEKDIYAILSPQGLRGYVFVEGMNTERLLEKTKEIKKARKFIEGETSIEDIEPYLTPASPVIGISEGDIVELVSGPFKGEKARVQKIDQDKEEITVELIEAMVPIPITVKADSVRVIESQNH
jgi:transcriptional antiterminator NusG